MRIVIFILMIAVAVLPAAEPAQASPRSIEVAQAPKPDSAADIAQTKRLADQGDAAAQIKIGGLYAKAGNYFEAARYFKLAADQGRPEAQSRLAGLNCFGLGMPKNVAECVRLYRLAADGGDTQAQVNLAARNLMGDGIPANYGEAVRLARLAADKGNSMGQFLLGMCYELGAGMPKNREEAVRLYQQAAAQGNASAQNALSRLSGKAVSHAPTVSVSTLSVPLQRLSGIFVVPAVLNEAVSTHFIVDSGASVVVIPEGVIEALRKAGKLTDSDFTGTQMVKLANGAVVKSRTFVLRSLSIKGRMLQNIRAGVAPSNSVPLLGQSFLERFNSWSIDNERQMLLLREKETTQ
jgi:clan AA aspartic protease (TIGR02281 family)